MHSLIQATRTTCLVAKELPDPTTRQASLRGERRQRMDTRTVHPAIKGQVHNPPRQQIRTATGKGQLRDPPRHRKSAAAGPRRPLSPCASVTSARATIYRMGRRMRRVAAPRASVPSARATKHRTSRRMRRTTGLSLQHQIVEDCAAGQRYCSRGKSTARWCAAETGYLNRRYPDPNRLKVLLLHLDI